MSWSLVAALEPWWHFWRALRSPGSRLPDRRAVKWDRATLLVRPSADSRFVRFDPALHTHLLPPVATAA